MKTVRFDCDVKTHVNLDDLEPFQGELKSLSKEAYQQMRKEIIETGFAFPIHAWLSPEGVSFVIGGHQRLRVLKELRDAEGFQVGPVPVVYIKADSIKQAKRRVLQDASQYGRVERQGLYEFIESMDLDPGDLAASFDLPGLDLPSFNAEFFLDTITGVDEKEKTGSKEYGENEFSDFDHKCPRCGFEFDA